MRIRHVACIAPPRLGGIGNAALRQVEGLRERGHEVELVVPDHPQAEARDGVKVWPTRYAWGNAALLKQSSDLWNNIDVLHLHYPFYGAAEQLLLWKNPPVPVVVSFHMDAEAGDWREWIFRAHRFFVQPWILHRVDRVIVASADYAMTSSLRAFTRRHEDRIQEIPFFVDDQLFTPKEKPRRPWLEVLFVGALDHAHEFKGLPVLLSALARTPWVRLKIVGDGNRRAAIEADVNARGLSAQVTFLGRVSQERLVQAYQEADVLVFPSTSKAEAFGLVALEAQACGTPVIASRLPGVREVVLHEKTGLNVTPGSVDELHDALELLHEDEELCARLSAEARAYVEAKFSRDRVLTHLEQLYEQLCASR